MRYKLKCTDYMEEMVEEVNALIAQGWKPQGGICVVINSSGDLMYFQAMVKEP